MTMNNSVFNRFIRVVKCFSYQVTCNRQNKKINDEQNNKNNKLKYQKEKYQKEKNNKKKIKKKCVKEKVWKGSK